MPQGDDAGRMAPALILLLFGDNHGGAVPKLCLARMASYLCEFQIQGGQPCCKLLKIAMEGRVSPELGI